MPILRIWESQVRHWQLLGLLVQAAQDELFHLLVLHNVLINFFKDMWLLRSIVIHGVVCLHCQLPRV